MRYHRSRSAGILRAALTTVALAACSSSSTTSKSTAAEAAPAPSPTAPAPAPAGATPARSLAPAAPPPARSLAPAAPPPLRAAQPAPSIAASAQLAPAVGATVDPSDLSPPLTAGATASKPLEVWRDDDGKVHITNGAGGEVAAREGTGRLYRWRARDGRVHITDRPPPRGAKLLGSVQ